VRARVSERAFSLLWSLRLSLSPSLSRRPCDLRFLRRFPTLSSASTVCPTAVRGSSLAEKRIADNTRVLRAALLLARERAVWPAHADARQRSNTRASRNSDATSRDHPRPTLHADLLRLSVRRGKAWQAVRRGRRPRFPATSGATIRGRRSVTRVPISVQVARGR
jgi:hypothetical protein